MILLQCNNVIRINLTARKCCRASISRASGKSIRSYENTSSLSITFNHQVLVRSFTLWQLFNLRFTVDTGYAEYAEVQEASLKNIARTHSMDEHFDVRTPVKEKKKDDSLKYGEKNVNTKLCTTS